MQLFIFVFCINLHISLKATVRALSCLGFITHCSFQLIAFKCRAGASKCSFTPANIPILWLFQSQNHKEVVGRYGPRMTLLHAWWIEPVIFLLLLSISSWPVGVSPPQPWMMGRDLVLIEPKKYRGTSWGGCCSGACSAVCFISFMIYCMMPTGQASLELGWSVRMAVGVQHAWQQNPSTDGQELCPRTLVT